MRVVTIDRSAARRWIVPLRAFGVPVVIVLVLGVSSLAARRSLRPGAPGWSLAAVVAAVIVFGLVAGVVSARARGRWLSEADSVDLRVWASPAEVAELPRSRDSGTCAGRSKHRERVRSRRRFAFVAKAGLQLVFTWPPEPGFRCTEVIEVEVDELRLHVSGDHLTEAELVCGSRSLSMPAKGLAAWRDWARK